MVILIEIRQLPILPYSVPYSTFGNAELNFCVRNGNRWILCFIITGMAPLVEQKPTFCIFSLFSLFVRAIVAQCSQKSTGKIIAENLNAVPLSTLSRSV